MISRRRALAGLALIALGLGSPSRSTADRTTQVALVVIVHPKSGVTAITSRTLSSLYLARPVDGLVALNLPARSPERVAFDARILKMTAHEVGLYWVDQAVRGERGAPRALANGATVARLVAKFPTAIGYVRSDQVPKGVRVVKIDGKLPADASYPLWVEVAR